MVDGIAIGRMRAAVPATAALFIAFTVASSAGCRRSSGGPARKERSALVPAIVESNVSPDAGAPVMPAQRPHRTRADRPPARAETLLASRPADGSAVGTVIADLNEQFAARASAFVHEHRDQRWAQAKEARLAAVVRKARPGMRRRPEVGTLVCRTTMCILTVSHASMRDEQAFTRAFSLEMSDEDVLGSHFDPIPETKGGAFVMRVLVFRRGYGMPGLGESP